MSIYGLDGKLCKSLRLENVPLDSASEAAHFYANALSDLVTASGVNADLIVGVGVAHVYGSALKRIKNWRFGPTVGGSVSDHKYIPN